MDQRLATAGLLYLPPSDDHDDDTLGQVVVNWFGQPVHVHVIFCRKKGDRSPNDLQIEAFRNFVDNRDLFFANVEQQLLDYYTRVRADCDLDAETKRALFPAIDDPRQLSSMTQLTGIQIGYFDGDDWSSFIGLLAECSWEEEHGLGVKIVDGDVVEIGFQDIVI